MLTTTVRTGRRRRAHARAARGLQLRLREEAQDFRRA
jgi:hypothetical protein